MPQVPVIVAQSKTGAVTRKNFLTASMLAGAALLTSPKIVGPAAAANVPSDARVRHKSVKVDGLDIFYREAGPKDAPAVLLLHGFPTCSQMFRNLIPALADGTASIAPDYPGFGHSACPARDKFEYTFDNLADVVEKFTEKLGLKKYALYVRTTARRSATGWPSSTRSG